MVIVVLRCLRRLHNHSLTGNTVGHMSTALGFKPLIGYVRKVFHLSLCLITFEDHSAHHVHKSGLKLKAATFCS